jgi:hypothetical protein
MLFLASATEWLNLNESEYPYPSVWCCGRFHLYVRYPKMRGPRSDMTFVIGEENVQLQDQ